MIPAWFSASGSASTAQIVLATLGGAALRGGVVILLVAVAVRLHRHASAAQRHLMWVVACCGQLLLLVLPFVIPAWRISVRSAAVAPLLEQARTAGLGTPAASWAALHAGVKIGPGGISDGPTLHSIVVLLLMTVWAVGTLTVLVVLLASRDRLRRAVADAQPLIDPCMLGVLDRARDVARVARPVSVKLHPATVPMVFGVLWPTIVLPVGAREWTAARLHNVLLHELEHIKRYDCLVQAITSVVCALYWFNPLIWLAARALQMEQEQACDDAVLAAGSRPRDYATDLLELTQAFRTSRMTALAALPFARPSQLPLRVRAIVDRSKRRSFVSRRGVLTVWGTGVAIMCPLVGVTPQWTGPAVPVQQTVRMMGPSLRDHNSLTESQMRKQPAVQSMLGSLAAAGLLAGTPARTHTQSRHAPAAGARDKVDMRKDTTTAKDTTTINAGNVITTINVDSVMKGAQDSMTGVLQTRVPGLRVQHAPGVPGNPSRIQLRGVGSVTDSSNPIVILNGKRVNANDSHTSPLDHIDPNSIETIEVLKGPSAVKLYGVDAAAGVIVITTKAATAGQTPTHVKLR